MKKIVTLTVLLLFVGILSYAQDSIPRFKWLRTGVLVGYSVHHKIIKQESDYDYNSVNLKFSNHFFLYNKGKNNFELLIEPSFYRSEHEMLNFWFISHTVENGDALRAEYMQLKSMNEYVLNIGIIYRRAIANNQSLYALLNAGPMYIDTNTERLKKGFAFSDIMALGYNYSFQKFSIDAKFFYRHVSNANIQKPNFGLNAFGFEVGGYWEL